VRVTAPWEGGTPRGDTKIQWGAEIGAGNDYTNSGGRKGILPKKRNYWGKNPGVVNMISRERALRKEKGGKNDIVRVFRRESLDSGGGAGKRKHLWINQNKKEKKKKRGGSPGQVWVGEAQERE